MLSTISFTRTIRDPISVEMGDIKVSSCLTDTLMCYGLGACVGVCIYDPHLKVAGLAHVVLPDRQNIQSNSTKPRSDILAGKFANVAIPFLVDEIGKQGGAHIFSHDIGVGGTVSRLEIGQRNVTAVVDALEINGVILVGEDVGGCHGRTVHFRVCDGMVLVQPIGEGETVLAVLGRDKDSNGKKSPELKFAPGGENISVTSS
jgi:chemotaxis protein CheD